MMPRIGVSIVREFHIPLAGGLMHRGLGLPRMEPRRIFSLEWADEGEAYDSNVESGVAPRYLSGVDLER